MPHDLNAWHVVALGAGATLVHAYHTIINAGGVKTIWKKFWNGPANPPNASSIDADHRP